MPLRLTYAWCRAKDGSYRVMLPRFDWWLVLEDLETAKDALARAVSGALLGAEPKWLYDFRHEGEEYVVEWAPSFLGGDHDVEAPPTDDRPILSKVADDWIERAARRRLPRPVGEPRAAQLALPLVHPGPGKRPRSLLFVGGPGVGKTTELRHLAYLLLQRRRAAEGGATPTPGLFATSAERLLAGMVYLGMWQERVLGLVDELSHEGDLLYVDRLAPLLRPQSDGATLANLFAGPMSEGEITLVAECTPAELADARRRDAGFVELFEHLHLEEPSPAELLTDLRAYAERTPKRLHPRALRRSLELLASYRRDRRFPGKAYRFLDALAADPHAPTTLYAPDVEAAFARQTGLPIEVVSDAHAAGVDHVAARLRAGVIGQDEACLATARAIAPFKAGLHPPDRPLATLLFAGPTGVGKTELAKHVAAYLFGDPKRLVRVDMSELATPGSAARLIAAGRGVQSLAESVRREPLAVVLLDEIEKAHPEVFDLLLGVLGEGRLTDALGRLVDFRMTFVVMTSNLGARDRDAVGFTGAPSEARAPDATSPTAPLPAGRVSSAQADYLRAVRDAFRPELLGRIDQVVAFRHLERESVRRITDLLVAQSQSREGFTRRGVRLEVTARARDRLAELGYDRRYGARPLRRALETHVITPAALKLAASPNLRDCVLRVGLPSERADITVPD
ncbi:MAG: ATP-dependent Clp protease ATP-binding subunit [Myxococcales bacterium]|nr:ATP-dependent Clp protease ATP-binding subunit [Myxococcales bacterium]